MSAALSDTSDRAAVELIVIDTLVVCDMRTQKRARQY